MKKEHSAFLMLLSGIVLAVAGFIVDPVGEMSDSVLWYVSQSLLYAGSVFGLSAYVDQKFRQNETQKTH